MTTQSIGLPKTFKKLVGEEFTIISETEFNTLRDFQLDNYGGCYILLSEDKETYTILPCESIRHGIKRLI